MIGLQVAEGDGAEDVVGLERRPVAALDADLAATWRAAAAAGVHLDNLLAKENPILDGVELLREYILRMVSIRFDTWCFDDCEINLACQTIGLTSTSGSNLYSQTFIIRANSKAALGIIC